MKAHGTGRCFCDDIIVSVICGVAFGNGNGNDTTGNWKPARVLYTGPYRRTLRHFAEWVQLKMEGFHLQFFEVRSYLAWGRVSQLQSVYLRSSTG